MGVYHQCAVADAPFFCTVVTASYLGQTRTLAASLRVFHPQAQLVVLLADRISNSTLERWQHEYSGEGLQLVTLDRLPQKPEVIERMCFYYTPFELCCALRGLLHQYMWQETQAQQWIFLDADIWVTHSLDELCSQLEDAALLLTPHRHQAPSVNHAATLENSLLCSGLYNAGFLGVRRCEESAKFIEWFSSRLESYALDDPRGRGWFVDQLWLNLAPQYFQNVQATASRGTNVGHWNLFDMRLEYSDAHDAFSVDGAPLLFFHFSGWDENNPQQLSAHAREEEQMPVGNLAAWRELSSRYQAALQPYSGAEYSGHECALKCFEDARPISRWMRLHFWELCRKNAVPFHGSPFSQSEYFYRAEKAAQPTLANRIARRLGIRK